MIGSLSLFTALATLSFSLPAQSAPYRRLLGTLGPDIPDGLIQGTLGALAGEIGVNQTYDYVVVGGGTGGSAIATRLAQAGHRVAIIEAGEFYELGDPVLASTPGGDFAFVGADQTDADPLVDWVFMTEKQLGANGRSVHYARGKCLGGSSALNFMIYQRGTEGSFQQWADLVDDQSYTFDNLLPYFKKSVQFTPPNTAIRASNASAQYNEDAFSSTGGPLHVSYPNYAAPFSSWVEQGLRAIGLPEIQDFNSGKLIGSQYAALTLRPSDQTRSSSEASFIQSAMNDSSLNLKIYTGTMAQRVLFDSSKTATGVEVVSNGLVYQINAAKEVIVSAGAFQSPQVLMLSGIGPASTLEQFGIPVVVDLPGVGQNMWDHVLFGPSYRVKVDTFTKVVRDVVYLAEQLLNYVLNRNGPLTSNSADYLGWEKVPESYLNNFTAQAQQDLAAFPDDWPNIEYISGPGYVGDFSNLLLNQPFDGYSYGTILGALVSPLSRGNVTIQSASIMDPPIINPNWLVSDTDAQVAVAAFKRAREAFASAAMSPVVIGEEYWPGPQVSTDEEILEVIRNSLQTVWHAACTCKMGRSDDPTAVVDSQARVYGVKNLRVVDASAFPILPPGHPQSAVYMLAEKIADLIINNGTASV
ncbi:hypothetical protein VTN77DRAFT_547 [Rasamsonia byssochlamydoides]|uniref:uncharacterized protein n=1 Tax=Rasamsonia byssochlamydoides TaxID=89139 RepID=UPI003743BF1A